MEFKRSTYRTLSGTQEVIEIPKKTYTQWIIYQDNIPKFFVDFFDLQIESNSMMNSLVLCAQEPINKVLQRINKRNNINLSIPRVSRLGIKIKSEYIELDLVSMPEEWLAYSL